MITEWIKLVGTSNGWAQLARITKITAITQWRISCRGSSCLHTVSIPCDMTGEELRFQRVEKMLTSMHPCAGEVDENVPIAATLKLVEALMQANKDFDYFPLGQPFLAS